MSDGMIGQTSLTVPDLIEPVVGFRTFIYIAGSPAVEGHFVPQSKIDPDANPFVEPNEFVTDPLTGKMTKNYAAIAVAYEKWRDSLQIKGERWVPPQDAVPASLKSPHRASVWSSPNAKA